MALGEVALGEVALGEVALGEVVIRRSGPLPIKVITSIRFVAHQ